MLFSLPNMQKWLENKWTNTLNFEHTIFLTESIITFLLAQHGFQIIKKHYFLEHSIFYCAVYTGIKQNNLALPNEYQRNKTLFYNMKKFYESQIAVLNKKLTSTQKTIYLFGAHLFSQYLLYHGLHAEKIKGILDNNPNKQNKRLYGTNLIVSAPQILQNDNNALVILNAGAYNKEIQEDIHANINSKVEIILF